MGEVALLQYHHGVPDVSVLEVYPQYFTRGHPATTPFDWAGPMSCCRGKCHPVGPGLVAPVCLIDLLSQPSFRHVVLGLAAHHQ